MTVSQSEISQELKMKQPAIARAIKKLKELNILVEGPRAGLNKTYRLNPYVAYKGKNRKETILDFEAELTKQARAFHKFLSGNDIKEQFVIEKTG